jgi:hypothetical protein
MTPLQRERAKTATYSYLAGWAHCIALIVFCAAAQPFGWLAMALLVTLGGAVFLYGSVMCGFAYDDTVNRDQLAEIRENGT